MVVRLLLVEVVLYVLEREGFDFILRICDFEILISCQFLFRLESSERASIADVKETFCTNDIKLYGCD